MQVLELLWSWPSPSLAGTGCCAAWCGERWSGRQPGPDRRAVLERGREINPGRRRYRGPGAACAQATWLCRSAVSESFWIRGEEGAELIQELLQCWWVSQHWSVFCLRSAQLFTEQQTVNLESIGGIEGKQTYLEIIISQILHPLFK